MTGSFYMFASACSCRLLNLEMPLVSCVRRTIGRPCIALTAVQTFCFDDCRPDGAKKAYVRLTADYDALDVANKIGII